MSCKRRSLGAASLLSVFVALTPCLAGCGSPTAPVQEPRLRVVNIGPASAKALTVWFPDDQIAFGDVSAGRRTAYRHVRGGVFPIAAYRLRVDGQVVTQPVLDWIGYEPMEGRAFTYTIDVNPRRSRLQIVRLLSATRDE